MGFKGLKYSPDLKINSIFRSENVQKHFKRFGHFSEATNSILNKCSEFSDFMNINYDFYLVFLDWFFDNNKPFSKLKLGSMIHHMTEMLGKQSKNGQH